MRTFTKVTTIAILVLAGSVGLTYSWWGSDFFGHTVYEFDLSNVDKRYADLLTMPGLYSYFPMNDAQSLCEANGPCRNKGIPNPYITYDPVENAALVTTREAGIPSRAQLRHYWPQLDFQNSTKVSLQWEFKYDEGYLSTGHLRNYKAFQLTSNNENLQWEEQCIFDATTQDAVCLPTTRYYMRWEGISEMTDNEPISTNGPPVNDRLGRPIDNWQPGGVTAAGRRDRPFAASDHMMPAKHSPFIIKANEWHRITLEFTFDAAASEMRVRKWLRSESTPTTLVLASIRDPERGFLLSNDLTKSSLKIQNWWLEMNSSQEGAIPSEARVWVKNLLVFKDASIPLD